MWLHLILSSSVQKGAPVSLRFKCPVCQELHAPGEAQDRAEAYKLLHLVPLGTVRSTWVTCRACKAVSRAEVTAQELTRYAPGEVNRFIRRSLPLVLVVLLILAVPALPLPYFALLFSVPALVMGWKFGGWVRRLALIEVALGVLLGIAATIALLLPETKPAKPTFAPIRKHEAPANPKP